MSQVEAAATAAGQQQSSMEAENRELGEVHVHGKYVELQNIISDEDDSADYVLEDVSHKCKPISYATAFNVGRGRPPVDYYWLAVTALAAQAILAPYLYLLELGCGLNLAFRSLQACRMSRSYFARSEFELAALTGFKSGRYAGGSLTLSLLAAAVTVAVALTVCLTRPDTPDSVLDFHFAYRAAGGGGR